MSGKRMRIGIMLGDPSGIGPELVARLLAVPDLYADLELVVVGDVRVFRQGQEIAGTRHELPVRRSLDGAELEPGKPLFLDYPTVAPGEYPVGKVSREAGKATFDTLRYTLDLARTGLLDGFVFAPLNKEALHLGGNPYGSELAFFRAAFGQPDIVNELNVMDELWTTRVTSHVGIARVSSMIERDRVLATIRFMDRVLRDYGHAEPRIAVAALNPHGGEGGLFGDEESTAIIPAIEQAQAEGIGADGPFAADTIFLRVKSGGYHGVVSMYHDQGQIAMKLMGFDRGVTVAGGLPVPIATPAHGTAHDITGKGLANPSATIAAFRVVRRMVETLRHRPVS